MDYPKRGQRAATNKAKKSGSKEMSYANALRGPKKSASNIGGASVGGGT